MNQKSLYYGDTSNFFYPTGLIFQNVYYISSSVFRLTLSISFLVFKWHFSLYQLFHRRWLWELLS